MKVFLKKAERPNAKPPSVRNNIMISPGANEPLMTWGGCFCVAPPNDLSTKSFINIYSFVYVRTWLILKITARVYL